MEANNQWVIDTDIIIDYLRGLSEAVHFLEKTLKESVCYLSAITVAELYVGVRDGKERQLLGNFFNAFEIISIDPQIACAGGLYRRDYGKSHGVGLADAIIAATVVQYQASLATLNKKHFPMLNNVWVPYTKG